MKKILLTIFLILLSAGTCEAAGKVIELSRSIYKIDVVKPEDGIVASATAFTTKVEEDKSKNGWVVTLTTCRHVLYLFEDKFAMPDMQTQFILHKFYPVPHTFVADKFTKKTIGNDIATIKYFTNTKPADVPIMPAQAPLQPNEHVVIYGCPKGEWPSIKIYNFLERKNVNELYFMPSSRMGSSGSPIINSRGEYTGVVSTTSLNFTKGEAIKLK